MTKHDNYKVTDSPIAVPLNLSRYGLSEVVNHLLEQEKPIPFDFMINNTLIRTKLKKFLLNHRLSTEDIIEIEYMPITSFSDEMQSTECPAWVGSLKLLSNSVLLAGCYNGQLRSVNSSDLSEINTIQAHELPIRAVTAWNNGPNQFFATAAKDNTAKCWMMSAGNRFNCVATLESAVSSVETLEAMRNLIVTGDWSGNLFAYDVSKLDLSHLEGSNPEKSSKKRRKNSDDKPEVLSQVLTAPTIPHQFTIHAHSQAISGLEYCSVFERLFTASWDHSIKQWDMERQECVHTIVGAKVATSLNLNATQNLIATSHSDGRIRLWDSRSREGTVTIATLSHATPHWVSQVSSSPSLSIPHTSQVKWLDSDSHMLCSSDYDGTVTAWDIRSPSIPLSTKEVHDGKALCLELAHSDSDGGNAGLTIFSGGSDCCIKSSQLNSQ